MLGKGVKKPNDLGVLKKVRELISMGKAKAVLGNHELNAILFHRISKDYLVPMRPHTENNMKQHKSFIKAFGIQLLKHWIGRFGCSTTCRSGMR